VGQDGTLIPQRLCAVPSVRRNRRNRAVISGWLTRGLCYDIASMQYAEVEWSIDLLTILSIAVD
jgi:hypothetical protein